MNEPIKQNPPSTAETTDSHDRMATFNRSEKSLAKAGIKVGSKPVVHAYTIHARLTNHLAPIQVEVVLCKSIAK